jgi:hypothetical protein
LSPIDSGPGFASGTLYTQSVPLGTAGADDKVIVVASGLSTALPSDVIVDSISATLLASILDNYQLYLSAWIIDSPGGTVDVSVEQGGNALDTGFEVYILTKAGDADATILADSTAAINTATLNFSTSGNAVLGATLTANSTCVLTGADVTQDIRSVEWYSSKIENDQSGSYTFSMTCTPSINIIMGLVF